MWGATISADFPDSITSWNKAWHQAMHFVEDPFLTLDEANKIDESFALGSVFCGTYRVLGGTQPSNSKLLTDLQRARSRASSPADRAHAEALTLMVDGNFTKAARCWDELAQSTRDFAAVRFAHDVYLHVGDEARRLRSSQRAFDSWKRDEPGWGFVAGQLSFAMEEAGLYDQAERLGREALNLDPLDLWARHSLAHLYESLDDSKSAFELLSDATDVWSDQSGLAVHIWWHLALRLIATGAYDEALAVHDAQAEAATTPFRLCDLISLLCRLELVGVDVGDRWDVLANRFADRPEWHTSGFLDVHAALLYTRRPDHEGAARFFDGLAKSHSAGNSENDHIFTGVVQPVVSALRNGEVNPARSIEILDEQADRIHRIGGSIAQRDLLGLTRSHFAKRISNDTTTNDHALETI